jgi:diguanylate cyclase (GGDEF)-like protein/PAS domain S-box-containing protein
MYQSAQPNGPPAVASIENELRELRQSERLFRTLAENSPDVIVRYDRNGARLYVNPEFERVNGITSQDIIGKTPLQFSTKLRPVVEVFMERLMHAMNDGVATKFDLEYERDGMPVWWFIRVIPEFDENGVVASALTIWSDISERKIMENKLRESERKLSEILENVDANIYLKDIAGRYLFANRRACNLFGTSMQEIVGKSDDSFFDAGTARQLHDNDRRVLDHGERLSAEEVHRNLRDGSTSVYLSVKLPLRNESGEIYALCGISTDITARKQMEEQVRQLAFYDALTGLPNRRLLNDRLSQAMASCKRTGLYAAAMFVDLDNFKSLNDRHGHAAGDVLLIEAALRLRNCVRQVDTVARFGGDEFVVVILGLHADKTESAAQASAIAEKIRRALAAPYVIETGPDGAPATTIEHQCTASIGVVLFSNQASDEDDILRWADTAMYQAKYAGRDLIRFYEPS